jgi:hypothetical protein
MFKAMHASKPDETPVYASHSPDRNRASKTMKHAPRIRFLASRAAGCALPFPLAHSLSCPLGGNHISFFLRPFFCREAASSSTGKRARELVAAAVRRRRARAVDNRCWFLLPSFLCFAPCLLAVLLARETLVFRRGRCRQPNSNLLTPQEADLRLAAIIIQGAGHPFLQDRKVTCRLCAVGVCIIHYYHHSASAPALLRMQPHKRWWFPL